jgi:hypothetical protein
MLSSIYTTFAPSEDVEIIFRSSVMQVSNGIAHIIDNPR